MIWITGDIHGDPRRFSTDNFPEQKEMTKDDYVIILGDFGLVWEQDESSDEKFWLDWLEDKPFTTLFIDGNHERFDRLYRFPVEEWNGGLTHIVRPHIRHLMRGEVFNLQDHSFLPLVEQEVMIFQMEYLITKTKSGEKKRSSLIAKENTCTGLKV